MSAIFGTSGDDYLYGSGIDANIHGDAGNDTIAGGHGNDTLSGSLGSDRLYGGLGNDSLAGTNYAGAGGSDTLYGGSRSDTFSLTFSFGSSPEHIIHIEDYSSEDAITINSTEQLTDVHYGAVNGVDNVSSFIHNENNEVVAAISGTEHFFLPS